MEIPKVGSLVKLQTEPGTVPDSYEVTIAYVEGDELVLFLRQKPEAIPAEHMHVTSFANSRLCVLCGATRTLFTDTWTPAFPAVVRRPAPRKTPEGMGTHYHDDERGAVYLDSDGCTVRQALMPHEDDTL